VPEIEILPDFPHSRVEILMQDEIWPKSGRLACLKIIGSIMKAYLITMQSYFLMGISGKIVLPNWVVK
jgi:hypothetical protein